MNSASTSHAAIAGDLTSPQYWNHEWRGALGESRPVGPRGLHPLIPVVAALLEQRGDGPADVLEIGCAPGAMLLQLASLRPGDRFHGVDFSKPGLAEAERLLAGRSVRASLHYGDLRAFEPGRKYDLVYSCGLIEHFTDPVEVLRHHARLCAPGGVVAVSVPNYRGRLQEWFIKQLDPAALQAHNLQIMDTGSLRQLCGEAGLREAVSGSGGRATIRSHAVRRTRAAKLLRRVAQTWNAANRLGPRLSPRRSVIWAYGRAA